jgi:hypothetical protein
VIAQETDMSEYQYYEFRAIDRPLNEQAQKELRQLSTRAEIDSISLTNVYHYGDFRGNENEVLAKYFDVFVYVANWGTHRLKFRLPRGLVDREAMEAYITDEDRGEGGVSLWTKGDYVLVELLWREEGGGSWEEGSGWLDRLAPLRADLLAGDYRCLYLAWLGWAQTTDPEEEEEIIEPPVPPGLQKLTQPLRDLAEFLKIKADLIKVAAQASGPGGVVGPSTEELATWIASQPEERKNGWLLALAEDREPPPRFEILREFRTAWNAAHPKRNEDDSGRRTVGVLLAASKDYKATRQRQEAEEKARARAAHLDSLAGREKALWAEVETAVASKKPAEYDRAVTLIRDLIDLADREGRKEDALAKVAELRSRHKAKVSFLDRLRRAGG